MYSLRPIELVLAATLSRLKNDNRRDVAELAARFYKGRSKVVVQNQTRPVF